jgi:hypothetical protein
MNMPVALAIDELRNRLYVLDQNNCRVLVYDSTGSGITEWGQIGTGDYEPGEFLRPWSINVDADGRVWVFDSILNAFQVFLHDGSYIGSYTISHPLLRTGLDFAIRGNTIYLVSNSTDCIIVTSFDPGDFNQEVKLAVWPSNLSVDLRWSLVAHTTAYRVMRSIDSVFHHDQFELLDLTQDTFFVDPDAIALSNSRYYMIEPIFESRTENDQEGIAAPQLLHPDWVSETYQLDDTPHCEAVGVTCESCHFSSFEYPDPMPDWWWGDQLCKSCHMETGMASPQQNHFAGSGAIYCQICHDPHRHQPQFEESFIRDVISTPNNGEQIVHFNHATDYIHGSPDYDGICEVCHTQTQYHRNSEAGDHGHFVGMDCLSCHRHIDGFAPEN